MTVEVIETPPVPLHQWTHDGDRVLLLRCGDSDRRGYNGFQWPDKGPVKPEYCSTKPDCASGGLFGWPWGVAIGGGKDPDYRGNWIVFSAPKEQVIALDGKCKVAAPTPDEVDCQVVYSGDVLGAMMLTHAGRMAWIKQNAKGDSASSGYSSSAASSGDSSSAASSGDSSSAASSGYRSSAASSGYRSSAASSGDSSSAEASGYRSSAASSGDSSSAEATGSRGIAAITGEGSTIEVGPASLGAVTADRWYWRVRAGAVVAAQWVNEDNSQGYRMLAADELGLTDGGLVTVVRGEVQR